MKWEQREAEFFGGITIRQQVQEFSAVFAVAFVVLADVWIYHFDVSIFSSILLSAVGVWLIIGLQQPRLVYPAWLIWVSFMEALIKILISITLVVTWVMLITPLSWVVRLLRLSRLDLRFKKDTPSYWLTKGRKDNDFSQIKQKK
jgi:hypothetical protein